MARTNEEKIRIFLTNDHRMVRQRIRVGLECETDSKVSGEADNSLYAPKLAHELRPEALILDTCSARLLD